MMLIGNIFVGMGVSIFKLSGLGNDPFSGMMMALAEVAGISYAIFAILLNIVFFAIQLSIGRKLIGLGTIINAILLGYLVTIFYDVWLKIFPPVADNTMFRVLIVCIGVIICSLGLSLYQTADTGVAPYDSLAIIMAKRFKKVSYFWCRISLDTLCVVACYAGGGIVGLGTLISALGFGPVIHFWDIHFSQKLLHVRKDTEGSSHERD